MKINQHAFKIQRIHNLFQNILSVSQFYDMSRRKNEALPLHLTRKMNLGEIALQKKGKKLGKHYVACLFGYNYHKSLLPAVFVIYSLRRDQSLHRTFQLPLNTTAENSVSTSPRIRSRGRVFKEVRECYTMLVLTLYHALTQFLYCSILLFIID